jgi:hypothetical protein
VRHCALTVFLGLKWNPYSLQRVWKLARAQAQLAHTLCCMFNHVESPLVGPESPSTEATAARIILPTTVAQTFCCYSVSRSDSVDDDQDRQRDSDYQELVLSSDKQMLKARRKRLAKLPPGDAARIRHDLALRGQLVGATAAQKSWMARAEERAAAGGWLELVASSRRHSSG